MFFFKKVKFILPIILLFVLPLFLLGAGGFEESQQENGSDDEIGGTLGLSEEVLKWRSEVEKACAKYEIPDQVSIILAIMMVESGGRLPDIMQSSESKGLPPNTINNEIESIDAGVQHYANALKMAREAGCDDWTAVGAYNYGLNYVNFIAGTGKTHTLDLSERYSREVVAPSLGNTTGRRYSYVNAVSIANGRQYLYWNGGNFHYIDLVKQYLGTSSGEAANPADFFPAMKQEMEKYIGWPYVWGGKNPSTGFDCSGLTAYLYEVSAGISLVSYTVSQYEQSVPVSLSEAQAGDLIFFRGTYGSADYISHVGIYINETTMFDSNSSGIGYHTWTDSYWSNHRPEIRRVVR